VLSTNRFVGSYQVQQILKNSGSGTEAVTHGCLPRVFIRLLPNIAAEGNPRSRPNSQIPMANTGSDSLASLNDLLVVQGGTTHALAVIPA
jgi:hypothetical protein